VWTIDLDAHGEFLRAKIKSLSDVTPAILELY